MVMDFLNNYKTLNNSFSRTLVFHFGTGMGFYSEFNNMIFSILVCLEKEIHFEMYSQDAHFGLGNGWKEFFIPFCKERRSKFHHYFNRRSYIGSHYPRMMITAEFLYKLSTGNLLTHDLFLMGRTSSFEHSHFYIPELKIDCDCQNACKILVEIVYKFNSVYQEIINQTVNKLELPDDYISFHIRGGDKAMERELTNYKEYMNYAIKNSECRNVFVATDDYTNIKHLQKEFPEYTFYTLTKPESRGYDQKRFNETSNDVVRENMIELFSTVEILRKSGLCIGTYGSNIGMFLGMAMPIGKFVGLDYDRWIIL